MMKKQAEKQEMEKMEMKKEMDKLKMENEKLKEKAMECEKVLKYIFICNDIRASINCSCIFLIIDAAPVPRTRKRRKKRRTSVKKKRWRK